MEDINEDDDEKMEDIKDENEEKVEDIFELGSKVILPGGKWFQGKKAVAVAALIPGSIY